MEYTLATLEAKTKSGISFPVQFAIDGHYYVEGVKVEKVWSMGANCIRMSSRLAESVLSITLPAATQTVDIRLATDYHDEEPKSQILKSFAGQEIKVEKHSLPSGVLTTAMVNGEKIASNVLSILLDYGMARVGSHIANERGLADYTYMPSTADLRKGSGDVLHVLGSC